MTWLSSIIFALTSRSRAAVLSARHGGFFRPALENHTNHQKPLTHLPATCQPTKPCTVTIFRQRFVCTRNIMSKCHKKPSAAASQQAAPDSVTGPAPAPAASTEQQEQQGWWYEWSCSVTGATSRAFYDVCDHQKAEAKSGRNWNGKCMHKGHMTSATARSLAAMAVKHAAALSALSCWP